EDFCRLNHGVTFPLFSKIDVRGEKADPLYKYLTEEAPFKGYETYKDSGRLIQHVVAEHYPDNAEGNGIK
ncbi:glutathione peroxidase, partial [Megasphaera massiliensis]|nr:glutathione peroxidase [Megasphaera massiliensis]